MLKRPPTRIDLRGEGNDSLYAEFEEAYQLRQQNKNITQQQQTTQTPLSSQQLPPSHLQTPSSSLSPSSDSSFFHSTERPRRAAERIGYQPTP